MDRLPHRCRRPIACCLLLVAGLLVYLHPRLGRAQATVYVRVSQIYGGGGNRDALFQHDFVELFNAGPDPVALDGWTVQYASAAGSNWRSTALDGVIVQPYRYLLIQQAAGTNGDGAALPAPDVVGDVNFSASAGKVRLVDAMGIVRDLVGYGDANEFEGAAPVPALSAQIAALRLSGGCTDANQNGSDFERAPPQPRNSTSPQNLCAPVPSPTAPPTPPPPPALFVSEFMADPAAVDDSAGEWLELYNPGPADVNLHGWVLADLGSDRHEIAVDLWLPVGTYVVLGRNGDRATNGGVDVAYVYRSLTLANGEDALLLLDPFGRAVDRVVWGADGLTVTAGASLERVGFSAAAPWQTAVSVWPGSAGDRGTPGGPYVLPPSPTPTHTATLPPLPTPTPTPTAPPPTATPTPTAEPMPAAPLSISEFLADPAAVEDSRGEWVELFNAGTERVNLRGWVLADGGRDRHPIGADVWIDAQAYVVLGRNGDPATNGGVAVDYVYSGFVLANQTDEIRLLAPGGTEADRVAYGAPPLVVTAGASLERTTFDDTGAWVTAALPWPGSAGDRGSPGAAYAPPPHPEGTRTPTPLPERPPALWPIVATPSPLQIEEVFFLGTDAEFVVLQNVSDAPVDLSGWSMGDAHVPGGGEGIYRLPDGYVLAPGELFIVARNGERFRQRWGTLPHAQFQESAAAVPVLARRADLATGQFALNDSGDEIVLVDPGDRVADAVAYGAGESSFVGLDGALSPLRDYSLQRVPGFAFPTTRDPRQRFLWAPPDPFAARTLPTPAAAPSPPLPDGLQAMWGSLGARSNLSPGGTAPAHFVAAAAAARGLHFLTVADPVDPLQHDFGASSIIHVPGWSWRSADGGQAVIYGPFFASQGTAAALPAELSAHGAVAQWQGNPLPSTQGIVAVSGEGVTAPAGVFARWQGWSAVAAPLLLAGNGSPPLPGFVETAPLYTGLAVRSLDEAGAMEALHQRRGWVTTSPGLALTLRTAVDDVWMGNLIAPANAADLIVTYADASGEPAGLALWQDDRPIVQLPLPPTDGVWRATVPAVPGALLYAVAVQADGDFAVTAPLRVQPSVGSRLWINEVLPIPVSDLNGDGAADTGDEFIELYNPGSAPVSLAGWQLMDESLSGAAARRQFTLGSRHVIGGGDYLLIWGEESRIGLNNSNERLTLLNPVGDVVDFVAWTNGPGADRSYARVPDGGGWLVRDPSPGRSNGTNLPPPNPTPTPAPWDVAGSAAPGTPGGEAVGSFGSVTNAKLGGLGDRVRFEGIVIVPPGLFNAAIYVADAAPPPNQATAWLGIRVYLTNGAFPELAEGDRVLVEGVLSSFRGEKEVRVARPEDVWRVGPGDPLRPLPVRVVEIGEALEGRLVTFEGIVTGYRGESILLTDPADPDVEPIPVTVRSSLSWRRPFVTGGERYRVVGVVGQFASQPPWNGGYRVLVRFREDLIRLETNG